jgi:type I restriction enzyme R subunit
MQQQRRNELELYKKIAQDDAFKQAMQDTIKRLLM